MGRAMEREKETGCGLHFQQERTGARVKEKARVKTRDPELVARRCRQKRKSELGNWRE